MNREQFRHILTIADQLDPDILVIGSQSILGSYSEDRLPAQAVASIEVDVAYLDDPDAAKADLLDGAIGEMSEFHQRYGIYGQGVEVRTATLPDGWESRVVRFGTAWCLEPHDLVISKLVADEEEPVRLCITFLMLLKLQDKVRKDVNDSSSCV